MALLVIIALRPQGLSYRRCPMPQNVSEILSAVLPMLGIVAVFWFLLIRPQSKKDKEIKKMRSDLKVGDRVCTIGGIYGSVIGIKDDTVTIEAGPSKERSKLIIARWAIGSVEGTDVTDDSLT